MIENSFGKDRSKIKKIKVYLLQHSYEKDNGCDETKTLGIFSSEENAKDAIQNYINLPGFKDMPDEFYIDVYELDKQHWSEGFGIPWNFD